MYTNVNAHTNAFFHKGNVDTDRESVCIFMLISTYIIICACTLLKRSHKYIESYQLVHEYTHKQHERVHRVHVCLCVCVKVHDRSKIYKGCGVCVTLIPNPSTEINKKPNPNKKTKPITKVQTNTP